MIHYTVLQNPDDRILKRASTILNDGGIVAFPTDTNWVLVVSPESKKGVDKLYKMKHADKTKHFSLLCNSISMASEFAIIDDTAFRQVKKLIPGPYTFIFPPTKSLPKVIKNYSKDKEIGIRIPNSIFCQKMIETHGQALLEASISPDMLEGITFGIDDTVHSYQIEEIFAHKIDMIIDPGIDHLEGPSSIIDFSRENEPPVVLREGIGDVSIFTKS